MRLGGNFALPAEMGPRRNGAIEARGDGLGIERQRELGRTLLAQIGGRGEAEAEIDGLVLPFEFALAGERLGQRRQAEGGGDVLHAAHGSLLVIEDVHRAILDADIPELDVAARLVVRLFGLGLSGLRFLRRLDAIAEADREHRLHQNHAMSVDLPAQQLAEAEIEHQPTDRKVHRPRLLLGIGEDGVADDDPGPGRKQESGGAVDLELAPGLLLDPRGDPVAHPVRRDEQIDEHQRQQRGPGDGSSGDDENPGTARHRRQREAPRIRCQARRMRRMRLVRLARRRLGRLLALHGPDQQRV